MEHAQVMAANSAQITYCYSELSHEHSIRLLHINAGSFGTDIRCSIQEVTLDDALNYHALSYTWGDGQCTRTIFVETPEARLHGRETNSLLGACDAQSDENERDENLEDPELIDDHKNGKPQRTASTTQAQYNETCFTLTVTTNLYDALQHLRLTDGSLTLWVDAICIDQNNQGERNQQIRHMRTIYHNAEKVLIWLGLADEDSNVAFDGINATCGRLGKLKDISNAKIPVSEHEVDALRQTFSSRGSRKWWERRWVIQEFAFAQQAEFRCGFKAIDQYELYVLNLYGDRDDILKATHQPNQWLFRLKFKVALSGIDDMLQIKLLVAGEPTLREVLYATRTFKATDPRDNIYALLSLCSFAATSLVPDYTKSVRDVYIEVTRFLSHEAGDLSPLCLPSVVTAPAKETRVWVMNEEDVPSWLPDVVNDYSSGPTLQFEEYNSSAGQTLDFDAVVTQDPTILRLEGLSCDTVEVITAPPDSNYPLQDITFQHWWRDNASILPYQRTFLIRHRLQKTFLDLSYRPASSEIAWASSHLREIEMHVDGLDRDALVITKVHKVLKHITRLPTIPGDEKYDFRKRCISLVARLDRLLDDQAQPAQTYLDHFLRALRMDLRDRGWGKGRSRMSDEEFAGYKLVFINNIRRGTVDEAIRQWFDQPEHIREATKSHGEFLRLGDEFYTSLNNIFAEGWRFCRMHSGRFGWLSEQAEVDDEIFVIYGSPVPFLLRPIGAKRVKKGGLVDKPNYTMVGKSYVQGIMNNEALAGDHESKTIYLH